MRKFEALKNVNEFNQPIKYMKKQLYSFFKTKLRLLLLALWLFATLSSYAQGSWTTVSNTAPYGSGGLMLLLSDGTVMAKSNAGGGSGTIWMKLTPQNGSYVNGTWSQLASMINDRLYFSSQVLKDGRVYVAGGEYGNGGSLAEVYNPLNNTWTATPNPNHRISDANSEILPDGRILQALVESDLRPTIIYDPVSNTYSPGPSTNGIHNESAWVKLADNSILYVDRDTRNSERYIPSQNRWITDATVPSSLYDPYGSEAGGSLLLPDGRAFFIGSSGTTAYYTPSGSTNPGYWTAGPNTPNGFGCPDGVASMLPNGNILLVLSPPPTSADHFPSPTYFYEFNYRTNSFTQINSPYGGPTGNYSTFVTCMLNLPDGTVMYSVQGDSKYYIYKPSGSQLSAGRPVVNQISANDCSGSSYTISGTGFNGMSEGTSYGDDWQMATNYPIIRLTNGSNVYYARTYNWNNTGVQTGGALTTSQFTLPAGLPQATYSLVVTANGITSDPVSFTPSTCNSTGLVTVYKDCNYGGYSAGLNVGDYTTSQLSGLGVLNNDVSSLKITEGYKVILYDGDNFTGASITLTADNSCLVNASSNWNDITSSIQVRTNGATNMAGVYFIQNRNSGLYMDVWGATNADGVNIAQGAYNGGANQQFQFNHLGDGTYQVLATHSMKSVDIDGIKTTDGANVQQWTYYGTPNQQFIVFPTGDGFYKLIPKHSGKVIEVANFGTANGDNIQQWTNVNQTSGQWKFVTPVAVNGTGDGLTGSYFNGMNFETPKFSRKDLSVNFDWGTGSPDASVNVDQFSARWTGQVQPRYSGIYTFYFTNDDGGRLWVNNQLLVDKWRDDGGTEVSGTIVLTGGQKYDIKFEYYENGGGAKAKLEWSSLLQSREVIPQSQLYSNPAPAVSITSPANNASFFEPANVSISSNATDGDGVAKVDYYNGATLIASTTSPYTYSWNNVAKGTYLVTAVATDSKGAFTISSPITINVNGLQNGTGDGLAANYFNGMNFETPKYSRKDATINFDWGTGSPDASVNVDQFSARWTGQIQPRFTETYTFYLNSDNGRRLWINNQLIVDKWIDDWNIEYTGTIALTAGQKYEIRLEYFENNGGAACKMEWSSPSQPREVVPQSQLYSNALPTVSITSPSNNASFTAPASITLSANAADGDGTVSKVDYYNGTSLIASTTSPFTYAWNNLSVGTYSVTAIATDNRGGVTVSTPVSVTVNSATVATVYQDCNYGGYAVSLAAGDYTLSQLVALGVKDNDLSSVKVQSGYEVILYADDNFGGASLVITSDNSCVVGNSFNDITTSLKVMKIPANNPPSVSITAPANNASFNAPVSITFSANATDADGSISKVEYFNGSQSIGVATTSPFNVTWSNVAAGTYSITAKATDNLNGVATSAGITVTVKSVVQNVAPSVSITSPTNNASFDAPASITFSANATDSDGSVSKVEYFNGSQSLGSSTTSPFNVAWNNVAAGTYTITAKATDNSNAVTTSSAVTITVKTVTTNTCSGIPQYVENGGYVDGSKVQNVGNSYQCKPYPYTGWCNGAAWAYAPGTGSYWTDAWTLIGSCSPSAPSVDNSSVVTISPNPAIDYFNINVGEVCEVTILNSQGSVVLKHHVSPNGTVYIHSLPAGIYSVKIETSTTVVTTILSKN